MGGMVSGQQSQEVRQRKRLKWWNLGLLTNYQYPRISVRRMGSPFHAI